MLVFIILYSQTNDNISKLNECDSLTINQNLEMEEKRYKDKI